MDENKTHAEMEQEIEDVLKENDYRVEKNKNIKGYMADLVAKKGDKMVIVEIKSKPILTSSVIDLYQLKKKFKSNIHFALVSNSGAYGDVGDYAKKMKICVYTNGHEFESGLHDYSQR